MENDVSRKEDYFNKGKREMERNFGVNAKKHVIYGQLLHNLSIIYINTSQDGGGQVCHNERRDEVTSTTWRNRQKIESLRRTRPDSKNSRDVSSLTSALSFGILE